MNLVLIEPEHAGPEVVVSGRQAEHLIRVVRPALGDPIRVGVIGGRRGVGIVAELQAERVRLRITLSEPPSPRPRVDLILAVPRPKLLGRVLASAATIGVGRLELTRSWRVDPAYLASPKLAPAALRHELVLGCEQGGSTYLPEVRLHRRFVDLLAALPPAAIRLVAHPRASQLLEEVVAPGDAAPVLLAVGPEGGWIDRELASLGAHGFVAVRASSAILRVDAAVPAILAQLELLARLSPARSR